MRPHIAFTNPLPPRLGQEATREADRIFVKLAGRLPRPLLRAFDETDYSDALREARRWRDEVEA